MIICLGPICFPIWHLFPVLLLLFAKIRDWFLGKKAEAPVPEEAIEDSSKEVPSATDSTSNGSELRHRKTGGGVVTVTSVEHWNTLRKESQDSASPLFVKFTATWCKPCKAIEPFYQDLSNKHPGAVFASVDVDDLDEIAGSLSLQLPTFHTYRGEKKVREVVGAFQSDLAKMVSEESAK